MFRMVHLASIQHYDPRKCAGLKTHRRPRHAQQTLGKAFFANYYTVENALCISLKYSCSVCSKSLICWLVLDASFIL